MGDENCSFNNDLRFMDVETGREISKVEELEISASDWLQNLIDYYEAVGKFLRANRVRRHKKKRIDKKWEKRYGYKTDVTRFRDL